MEKNEVYLFLRAQDAKHLEFLFTQHIRILNANYKAAERLPLGLLADKDEFLERIDFERKFLMSFRDYLSRHSDYRPLKCFCMKKCPFALKTCCDCRFSINDSLVDRFGDYDSNII